MADAAAGVPGVRKTFQPDSPMKSSVKPASTPSVPGLSERADIDLVKAAGAGDGDAFEELYRRYRDWVVALAYRFTGDNELALDVLQETMAYFFRRLPSLQLNAKLTTFLYPAVRHTSITLAQRRRRDLGVGEPGEEAGADLSARHAFGEGPSELREAIAALPSGQSEVLLMRYASGMSEADIAEALRIPKGTVKSRLHHAIRRLKDQGLG